MTIDELMVDFRGTPCWACEHMFSTGSSLFGTSEECSIKVDGWYDIYDKDHEQCGDTLVEHCKNTCSSFSEGEGKSYYYG